MPISPAASPCLDSISVNAARALAEALQTIDIKLPSMRGEGEVNGKAFVHLGGCAADEAFALAHWIRDHQ
ncbi:hypothetical protein ACFY41_18975 [Streptomyces syringium]|uniref:hypothetical protein n=1 Tax=Streptomyces syringium TaxID=76729 RepID=UPI00369DD1DE